MKAYSPLRLLFVMALLTSAPVYADVRTLRVDAQSMAVVHTAEATLEAINQVTVSAQMPGRILELRVDAGDRVERGDLLLRIDSAETDQALASADAAVAQAQAVRANAKTDYDRAQSLVQRNFISQSAVDQAKATFEATDAALRAARAVRSQTAVVLGYADVASPITGIVAERHVESGEMAQPGMPLVTVFDPLAMRAVVDVPQGRLADFGADALGAIGASVELPESGRRVQAVGVTVMPAADVRTHTLRVRVELPANLEGVSPGMFARVHFITGQSQRIAVPATAILRRSEVTAVYVVDARRAFSMRQIRLGKALQDGTIEVLAGLSGGEEIALDPVQAGIVARAARADGR